MTDLPHSPIPLTPAGWYPDHTGVPQLRWWDGTAWTDSISDGSVGTPSYSAAPYALRPAPTGVPTGTPVYNPIIWIMALLPLLGIVTLLTLDASALVASPTDPLARYRDPGYLATLALGWIVFGAAVILAYFDRKRLLRDGYDRPFHWAWTFFGGGVYVIGRSIIVRRRSGRGLAPIWLWIGVTLVVTVVALAKVGQMMSSLINSIPLTS